MICILWPLAGEVQDSERDENVHILRTLVRPDPGSETLTFDAAATAKNETSSHMMDNSLNHDEL